MWSVTVNGVLSDREFSPDITKMEVELDCRIEYGLNARLDIQWIDEVQEESTDE